MEPYLLTLLGTSACGISGSDPGVGTSCANRYKFEQGKSVGRTGDAKNVAFACGIGLSLVVALAGQSVALP